MNLTDIFDFLSNPVVGISNLAQGAGGDISGTVKTVEQVGQEAGRIERDVANLPGEISSVVTDVGSFLSWIAWIFNPLNLLRAVEFIFGLATMVYGVHTLAGVMRRSSATHRTSLVRSVIATFTRKRPTRVEKGDHITRAQESGTRQGERDVAYRQARHAARQHGLTGDT